MWLEYSQVRAQLASRRTISKPTSRLDSPVLSPSFWGPEETRPSLLQTAVFRLREDCRRLKRSKPLSQDCTPFASTPRRMASTKAVQVSPRLPPALSDISSILATPDFYDVSFAQPPLEEKQYSFISKWQPKPYLLRVREKGGKLVTWQQPHRWLELGVPLHSHIEVSAAGISGGFQLFAAAVALNRGERLVRVLASGHCVFLSPREVLCSSVLPTALLA